MGLVRTIAAEVVTVGITIDIHPPFAVIAGHALVVSLCQFNVGPFFIEDNKGNTYNNNISTGSGSGLAIFSAFNIIALTVSDTISIFWNRDASGEPVAFQIDEYDDLLTTDDPFDSAVVHYWTFGFAASLSAGPTTALVQPSERVIALFAPGAASGGPAPDVTVGTGYTQVGSGLFFDDGTESSLLLVEARDVNSTVPVTATASSTNNNGYSAVAATYRLSGTPATAHPGRIGIALAPKPLAPPVVSGTASPGRVAITLAAKASAAFPFGPPNLHEGLRSVLDTGYGSQVR